MNWNKWVRQYHRWLSIVFVAFVIANIVLNISPSASEQITLWVGLSTLIPLALLLLTGLYLFVLPYVTKSSSSKRVAQEEAI